MDAKPTSTIDLALTLVDLAKAGAVLFAMMLIEFAQQKEAKARQRAEKEHLDAAIAKAQPVVDPLADPRDVVERHLKGKRENA